VTHNLKRILILAVCCAVITVMPAAANSLSSYLSTPSVSGTFNQTVAYGGNGDLFTDGNLQFQFTGLTITPTCWDGIAQVSCATGSYNPVSAASLSIIGTSGINGDAGFDLTGQTSVSSYKATDGDQINVIEDIDLNYTVSTISGAASISDAHLDVGGCVQDLAIQSTCLTSSNGLPPNLSVNEFWAGTNQTLNVTAPPPILDAYVNFLPTTYSSLQASKDIALETGACAGCVVSFSDLKQYYSEVPEPRTYAWILAVGLLGLAQLRRRLAVTA